MKLLTGPFVFLFKLYFGIIFFGSFLFMWPATRIFVSKEKWYKYAFEVKRIWSRVTQVLTIMPNTKTVVAPLPEDQPYIICANHTSYLDIILMPLQVPHKFIFMAKSALLKWPLLNVFFKHGMDVPVNRSSTRDAIRALNACGDALDKGWSVVIFPEGTMPDGAPKMKRFKNGAFKLAIEKQVPIVPITFLNSWRILSDASLFKYGRPGLIKAVVHAPVYTKGMTEEDLVSLREHVFDTINGTLTDYEDRRKNG